jgi:hypothetical protein
MLSFSGWRGVAYSSSGVAATTLQDCKRPAFTKQSFPCFPFAFFRVFRGQFLLFPLASFAGWGTIMMDLQICAFSQPSRASPNQQWADDQHAQEPHQVSHESNRKEPPTRQYVDAPVYCVRAPPEVQTLAPACSGNHPCQAQGTFPDRPAWHGPSWR